MLTRLDLLLIEGQPQVTVPISRVPLLPGEQKQSIVAWSCAKDKFQVMAHGICEGIWLK